jgi:hypothetical protein
MKCPECGSEVGPGEQFCGNCGAPVEATEAPPGDETVIAEAPVIPPLEPEEPLAPEEPDLAPPPPPPPPIAEAAGSGKKKTGMIIAIIAVVVILLCCCCIAAVAIFLNSDAGQDLLYELDLAMRPLLTTLV